MPNHLGGCSSVFSNEVSGLIPQLVLMSGWGYALKVELGQALAWNCLTCRSARCPDNRHKDAFDGLQKG